ncbi:MAG: sialate O-acetylesterase [Oscillospiraceae bacterium]|nr:sialate O-acetylesterase [Oscillospiraceae bacterium]
MLKDFSKEKFDIIIQAGQSNAEGYGFGDVDGPFEPHEGIYFLNGDFTVSLAAEHSHGERLSGNFSLSFADAYIKNGNPAEGRKLLILRSAVGGTGFCDKRWGLKDDLFLRMVGMIETALALNPENRLAALLWHQGENEAGNVSYDEHFKKLKTLVEAVRNTFKCGNLPFIAADFVHEWKSGNAEACEPIIRAIKDVCAAVGSAGFIETDGLLSNNQKLGDGDTIHFCREALYRLGRRYFEVYNELSLR